MCARLWGPASGLLPCLLRKSIKPEEILNDVILNPEGWCTVDISLHFHFHFFSKTRSQRELFLCTIINLGSFVDSSLLF